MTIQYSNKITVIFHCSSCDCKEALTLVKLKDLGYLSFQQKQEKEKEEREQKRIREEGLYLYNHHNLLLRNKVLAGVLRTS